MRHCIDSDSPLDRFITCFEKFLPCYDTGVINENIHIADGFLNLINISSSI